MGWPLGSAMGSDYPMIPSLDIYRSAQALVKHHGPDAPIHAAMRADELLESGDLDGVAVSRPVLRAVEELQRMGPVSGEVSH